VMMVDNPESIMAATEIPDSCKPGRAFLRALSCLDTSHCNIVTECPTRGLRKDGTHSPIP
jgi:hypothetical protein